MQVSLVNRVFFNSKTKDTGESNFRTKSDELKEIYEILKLRKLERNPSNKQYVLYKPVWENYLITVK